MAECNGNQAGRPVTMRDVVGWPALRRIAARFGLDRIEYDFVAARRSFHGKAIRRGDRELVRLPLEGNSRHPAYLCLTVLHEWAHVLQGRQPQAGLPHGPAWTAQFQALCGEACRLGLFVGNEAEVLRHAASGEARTSSCRLLGNDGRPLGGEPRRSGSSPSSANPGFQVGDKVECEHNGRRYAGTVVRVNAQTYTVRQDDQSTFRVLRTFAALRKIGSGETSGPSSAQMLPVGTRVRFPHRGRVFEGVIERVNRTNYRVVVEGQAGFFRIRRGWSGLRPIVES